MRTRACQEPRRSSTSFVTQLVAVGSRHRPRHRHRGLERIRRAAVRSRRRDRRPGHVTRRSATSCCQAPRAAAVQARQAAVPRRRRSHQSARASTRSSSRPAMSIEFVVVEDDKLQKAVDKAIEQADAADAEPHRRRGRRSREPRSHRRRRRCERGGARPRRCRRRAHRALRQQDHARCHQEAAPRTSTSSPTKRPSASAPAWTAC